MVFVCMLGLFDLTTSIAHLANLVFTIHTMTPTLNAELLTTVDLSSGPLPLSLLVQLYWRDTENFAIHWSLRWVFHPQKRACNLFLLVSIVTGLPFPFAMGNWCKMLDEQNNVKCLLGNSGEPKDWPFIYFVSYFIATIVLCFFAAGFQIIIWKRILIHLHDLVHTAWLCGYKWYSKSFCLFL